MHFVNADESKARTELTLIFDKKVKYLLEAGKRGKGLFALFDFITGNLAELALWTAKTVNDNFGRLDFSLAIKSLMKVLVESV